MNHLLHLFDTPETVGHTVASFFLEGYQAGDHLLMIAKPRHRQAVLTALREHGCFPSDSEAAQRLVAFDAADVLRHITRNGVIDPVVFRKMVQPVLNGLRGPRPVRIYGEVVEILAEEEDMAGALALEGMWNDLAAEAPITLMCGYSSAHFAGANTRTALRQICNAHTCAAATDEDPLGRYLLAIA